MSEHFKKSDKINLSDEMQHLLVVSMETGYRYALRDKRNEMSTIKAALERARYRIEQQEELLRMANDKERLQYMFENRYKIKEYDRMRRQAQRLLEENRELKRRNAMLWKELQ